MNSWAADLGSLSFQPLTVVKDLTVFVPLKSHDAQVKKQPIVFANVAYKFVANEKSWYDAFWSKGWRLAMEFFFIQVQIWWHNTKKKDNS